MTAAAHDLFLPCAAGVEDYLAAEVVAILGCAAGAVRTHRAGVALRGGWDAVLRLNLHSRMAQRVLVQLVHAPYRDERDVYALAHAVPWAQWFTPRQTFKIEITAQNAPLKSLNFAALTVKDAVCDRFRTDCAGVRPSVDTHQPDVRVYAHLSADTCTLSIDTSGEALFKRGWREQTGDAPLKETLAAAMLAACGWAQAAAAGQALPLYDPCCGSGTVVIEAAQIACRIAPGLRRSFAFERLQGYDRGAWNAIKTEASSAIITSAEGQFPSLFGSDVAHRMVDFAQRNAERAGVAHALTLRGGDALQRLPPVDVRQTGGGVLLLNPPYGERIDVAGVAGSARQGHARLGSADPDWHTPATSHPLEAADPSWGGRPRLSLRRPTVSAGPSGMRESAQMDGDGAFFERLAAHWKRHYAGWTAWILSPDRGLPGRMHLKASRRVPLWNGPIECRLMRFDLVAGRLDGAGASPALAAPGAGGFAGQAGTAP